MTTALLFGANLVGMVTATVGPLIHHTHCLNHQPIMDKMYQQLDPDTKYKFKLYSNAHYCAKINLEIENEEYKNDVKEIFGHKVSYFECKTSSGHAFHLYQHYKKHIRRIAINDFEEYAKLDRIALKSIVLCEDIVYLLDARVHGYMASPIVDGYGDKEFVNAVARYTFPGLERVMCSESLCPNIEEYIIDEKTKKWDKSCMITREVLDIFAKTIRKLIEDAGIEGFVASGSIDDDPDKKLYRFEITGEIPYAYPVVPVSKNKITPPAIFIDGGHIGMDEHELPEETRRRWTNVEANTKVQEAIAIEEKPIEEKVDEVMQDYVIPNGVTIPEGFKPAEFKKLVKFLEEKFSDKIDYVLRKDNNGTIFIDVKNENGEIVSNIIDTGRFAGGERYSVIGTAVMSNNPEIRYAQFVDISKLPEVALKILKDARYHLTEEERLKAKERFASPIIYEWFDFKNAEFINKLNDVDLEHFFTACFNAIVRIDSDNSFRIAARLRIVNFIDISNFTIISDEECKSPYLQYGIKQNNVIIPGLRLEIRNGVILDNSSRIIEGANPVKFSPFMGNVPQSPIQMFDQIQSANITQPMTSGFMPANAMETPVVPNNEQTVLPDGSFIPNFGVNKTGIRDGMTYEEVKAMLHSPISGQMYEALVEKYPVFVERCRMEGANSAQ